MGIPPTTYRFNDLPIQRLTDSTPSENQIPMKIQQPNDIKPSALLTQRIMIKFPLATAWMKNPRKPTIITVRDSVVALGWPNSNRTKSRFQSSLIDPDQPTFDDEIFLYRVFYTFECER